ncbi:MAG: cytochrome [Sediminibacterium sp.]|nr:cytochrome [Sediminibacterium sp.]
MIKYPQMKVFKKVLLALLVVFILMQAFRPKKNLSGDTRHDISTAYAEPEAVHTILVKACNDCHSNKTRYPWYAEVQPAAWWLNDHVNGGKRKLNFNEFTSYRIAQQYKKLEECIDMVKQSEMPLPSYTWIHRDAILTEAEKQTFLTWCNDIRDTIRAKYPTDSILIKRK